MNPFSLLLPSYYIYHDIIPEIWEKNRQTRVTVTVTVTVTVFGLCLPSATLCVMIAKESK